MYAKYYGLTRRPFENTPDPDFLFLSKNHREVLASLVYAINASKGFVLIVGDVGTGKTTLIHALIKELDPSFIVLNVTNSRASFNDILYSLGKKVGIIPEKADPLGTAESIQKRLETLHEDSGRQAVLIVDEAHLLSEDALEDVRLISNIENEQRKLIQIILVGQNELSEKLERDSLKSLKQRVVVARKLLPLSRKETQEYILHRLRVAGRQSQIFEGKALSQIWKKTQGIPRLINQVCDNAMLIGYAVEARSIGQPIIKEVIKDMESVRMAQRWEGVFFLHRRGWVVGILVIVCLAVYLGLIHTDVRHFFSKKETLWKDSVTGQGETSIGPKTVAPGEKRELPAKDSYLVRTRIFSKPGEVKALSDATGSLSSDIFQTAKRNRLEKGQKSSSVETVKPGNDDGKLSGELQYRVGGENSSAPAKKPDNGQFAGVPFQTSGKRLLTEELHPSNREKPVPASDSENGAGESEGALKEKCDEKAVLHQPADFDRPAVLRKASHEKPDNIRVAHSGNRVKVGANECLISLARREYGFGNASIVDLIHGSNPGIKDVNRIYPGQEIVLPEIKSDDLIVKDENGAYHIFYASFFRREDARRCVQNLRNDGEEAHTVPAALGRDTVYRVYVGTFESRDDAKKRLCAIDLKYIKINLE